LTREIHLVVTCPRRRRREPSAGLALRAVPGQDHAARWVEWRRRLEDAQERAHLGELYVGGHWRVVRSLAGATARCGAPVRVWVCAAGLGLVRWDALVPPCAASFHPGDPDCASRRPGGPFFRADLRAWWGMLSAWAGPEPGQPRSVAELVRCHPGDSVLVVVSEVALHALADDLRNACGTDGAASGVAVLTTAVTGLEHLSDHLVPCAAPLRRVVGGTLQALPVSVAGAALLEWCEGLPSAPALRGVLGSVVTHAVGEEARQRRRRAGHLLALFRAAVRRAGPLLVPPGRRHLPGR
jgi:hypothetical protein